MSIAYVAWVYAQSSQLHGIHRHAREQWLRASQSIPLNIAEGNGKPTQADRRKYFAIARDSALKCPAIEDVLSVGHAIEEPVQQQRKQHLDRIATMLSKRGGRGCRIQQGQSNDEIEEPDDALLRHLRFAPSILMVITVHQDTIENVEEPKFNQP